MKTVYRDFIKERLKYYRELMGKTQEEFAQLLNMKPGTYATYEQGCALPSIFLLKKVCKLAKIKLDKFMEGSPEEVNTATA